MPDLLANGPLDTALRRRGRNRRHRHAALRRRRPTACSPQAAPHSPPLPGRQRHRRQCRRRQPYHSPADPRIESCTNPLAASGGVDPETADQIRRRAPQAFLTQERAITMTDYATVAEANSQVEDAAATPALDRKLVHGRSSPPSPHAGGDLSARAADEPHPVRQPLPARRPGPQARGAGLRLARDRAHRLRRPGLLPSDVAQSLRAGRWAAARCPTASPASSLPATSCSARPSTSARSTAAARVGRRRQHRHRHGVPAAGQSSTKHYLHQRRDPASGPFQVARLDNDPSLPDHGQLTLVHGGRKMRP